MKDFFFKQAIQGLEKAGNNDFELIIEFGADAYSTKELKTILKEVSRQQQMTDRWYKKLIILGFTVSLCMAASILAGIMDVSWLSYVFLATIPVFLLVGLIGHVAIHAQYPNLSDHQLVISIIQQELEWRKQDRLIF